MSLSACGALYLIILQIFFLSAHFKKKSELLHRNFHGDKIYMKVAKKKVIYKFVVYVFFSFEVVTIPHRVCTCPGALAVLPRYALAGDTLPPASRNCIGSFLESRSVLTL